MHTVFCIIITLLLIFYTSVAAQQSPMPAAQYGHFNISGKWEIAATTSPIDDSTNIYMSLKAEKIIQTSLGQSLPTLFIRCQEKRFDVYIDFSVYLGVGTIDVLYRLDQEKAENTTWAISTNHQAVFVAYVPYFGGSPEFLSILDEVNPAAKLFIRKLVQHEKLLIQLTPYGENSVITTFDVRGISESIKPMVSSCLEPALFLSNAEIQDRLSKNAVFGQNSLPGFWTWTFCIRKPEIAGF